MELMERLVAKVGPPVRLVVKLVLLAMKTMPMLVLKRRDLSTKAGQMEPPAPPATSLEALERMVMPVCQVKVASLVLAAIQAWSDLPHCATIAAYSPMTLPVTMAVPNLILAPAHLVRTALTVASVI